MSLEGARLDGGGARSIATDTAARPGWSKPLRLHLSVIIVVLLVATSGPLMWITYSQGTRSAVVAAEQQMRLLSQHAAERYNSAFNDGYAVIAMASVLPSLAAEPPAFIDAKKEFLIRALKGSGHLDAIYFGYPNGAFVQLIKVRDNPRYQEAVSPPAGADFAMRFVERAEGGVATSTWRFLDDDGGVLEERLSNDVTYDPRRRPWYRAGLGSTQPVAVGPYVSASTNTLTLSLAMNMAHAQDTVIGTDVLLETIGHLFAEQAVSDRSSGYLFAADGRLIVHSDPEIMKGLVEYLVPGPAGRSAGQAAEDPVLNSVRGLLQSGVVEDRTIPFNVGGEDYLAFVSAAGSSGASAGNRIVVAAPVSDFTEASVLLLKRALTVAGFLVTAGVLAALIISRMISRALNELEVDARRIGDLDFAGRQNRHSWITEINTLAGALGQARDAIRTFALYVPRELVRKIIAAGQAAIGQAARQDVTILFTDIRDFTTISEQHSPEEVVDLLSVYFQRLNELVQRHNGVIVQYLGDSIYAMWNAPTPDPDHVDDACRCTLALLAAVNDLNAENRQAGRPELVTRFGLHTGPAVVGSVGASARRQYTAMGDTVNVASRLEGMNKQFATSILASAAVRSRAGAEFSFRSLGLARAKGRMEEIEVFELSLDTGGKA